jgi:hypothetical protein
VVLGVLSDGLHHPFRQHQLRYTARLLGIAQALPETLGIIVAPIEQPPVIMFWRLFVPIVRCSSCSPFLPESAPLSMFCKQGAAIHGRRVMEVWQSKAEATQFFARYVAPNLPPGIQPKRTFTNCTTWWH